MSSNQNKYAKEESVMFIEFICFSFPVENHKESLQNPTESVEKPIGFPDTASNVGNFLDPRSPV